MRTACVWFTDRKWYVRAAIGASRENFFINYRTNSLAGSICFLCKTDDSLNLLIFLEENGADKSTDDFFFNFYCPSKGNFMLIFWKCDGKGGAAGGKAPGSVFDVGAV